MNSVKSGLCMLWLVLAAVPCLQGRIEAQAFNSYVRQLHGVVLDEKTGERVSEVTVLVTNVENTVSGKSDGTFQVGIPASAACTLIVSKPGYVRAAVPVEAGDVDVSIEVSLEPASLDELPKMMVNADRKKSGSTEDISKMSIAPEMVRKLPTVGQADLFRSLQLLPGVSGTNESSSGLYVRGGTPDQNLILFDGVPIYYVDHFYGFFSTFNPNAIDEVTLFKGGFGPKWGGRLSSVVELSSVGADNKYDSEGVQAILGAGFLSSDGFLKIPLKNNELGTIMLAGRRSMNDLYKTDLFSNIFGGVHGDQTLESRRKPDLYGGRDDNYSPWKNDYYTYQPEISFWDLNGMAAFRLGSRGKLVTTLFASKDYEYKTFNLDASPWYPRHTGGGFNEDSVYINVFDTIKTETTIRNREPMSWGNTCAGQKWEQKWTDAYSSSLNLTYSEFIDERSRAYTRMDLRTHRFSDSTENPEDSVLTDDSTWEKSKNRILDISARFDNTITLGSWNTIRAGVEFSRKIVTYDRDTIQPDTNSIEWLSMNPLRRSRLFVHSRDTGLSVALYAGDEMKLGGRAGLSFGARLYYFNLLSKMAVDPRISGWLKVYPDVKVKGAWGIYTQEIHRAEKEDIMGGSKFVWLLANENRPLEKSQHFIGGVSWEKKHYLLNIEGYYKRLSGLLTISEQLPLAWLQHYAFDPDNLNLYKGSGTVKGVECLAQVKDLTVSLLSRKLTYDGWAAYTWSRVENTYDVFNLGNPFPATQDRPHEIKLVNSIEYDMAGWSSITLGAIWLYATGTPYTMPLGMYRLQMIGGGGGSIDYQYVSDKNRYRLPDYHRLDLSAAWKLRLGRIQAKLTFGVFNVYDHENVLDRTFNDERIGNYGPITTTVYTPIDKLSLSVMPNASLEITTRF